MPILMIPISVFYFGKFSWLSVFSNLCLAWTWELLWIPLGFVLPIVGVVPSGVRFVVLDGVGGLWNFFENLHLWSEPYVRSSVCTVVKLTAPEVFLIELICLLLLSVLARCINSDNDVGILAGNIETI